jgi:hypothetical protein
MREKYPGYIYQRIRATTCIKGKLVVSQDVAGFYPTPSHGLDCNIFMLE